MLRPIRALPLFFLLVFFLALRTFWILSHTFTPDFSVYYQSAKNMLASVSVYTGPSSFTLFAYPLVSALFFLPFSFLPYQISQTIFLLCNFVALLGISYCIPFLLLRKQSIFFSALVFSFSYLSFPTKFTLGMGQINLVAYLFLLLSAYVFQKKKLVWTSAFFAFACMLKPILGFMVLFWIFQKQWRVIGLSILFLLLGFSLSTFVDHHAIQDYFYYIQYVIPEVSRPVGKEIYYNQGFMSFVFREIPIQQWHLVLSYLGLFGIAGILFRALYKQKNMLYQFALLLSTLPLLDTVSWQHHFIVLIFPYSYAAYIFLHKKLWKHFVVLCISYLFVSWNFAHPLFLNHFPESILLSNTFYGAFILFVLFVLNERAFSKSS